LPEDQQLACLGAAVDEVNQEAAGARPAAQAWADGRLGEVKAHWATAALDRCLLPNARVQALLEKGTADATREVDAALRTPGRTVALVDLHFLMRSDGLLDRLKAEGAEISSPST
ncbi:MAG: TraB/GumN family protein, partial [Caulobacteraceae bacterium]|nr:TraB/GumN family protein [Caulobacter sp.]